MSETELDPFLARLERALPRRERTRALREARDHVLCAAEEHERQGAGPDDALARAIAAYGPVDAVAAGYRRGRPEVAAASALAVAAAVVALMVAPTGGWFGQAQMPASHAADTSCAPRHAHTSATQHCALHSMVRRCTRAHPHPASSPACSGSAGTRSPTCC